jgi:hypothetical protein
MTTIITASICQQKKPQDSVLRLKSSLNYFISSERAISQGVKFSAVPKLEIRVPLNHAAY